MDKQVIYTVAPAAGGWLVRLAGDSQTEGFTQKEEAIGRALQLARRSREWRVRVLSQNGAVETELDGSMHGATGARGA